jgi:D-alanine--poly(phosphoribitol) ligase subunit 2
MDVAQRVLRILEQITKIPDVGLKPDLALYDLQLLDSLSTVEIMLAFSGEFGLEISPAEFDRDAWRTPHCMIQDVEARLARLEASARA